MGKLVIFKCDRCGGTESIKEEQDKWCYVTIESVNVKDTKYDYNLFCPSCAKRAIATITMTDHEL